jgi:FixJ family two-component response regulator
VKRIAILSQVPVIAIVEDDASVRTATQSLVRSLGFTACTFACAEEFIQSPRRNDASCVITDVQMPGMSGVELQSLLIAEGRRTPIIFITAFHDEGIRARAMKAGAICFLSKPVDGQTLIECVFKALNRHKLSIPRQSRGL